MRYCLGGNHRTNYTVVSQRKKTTTIAAISISGSGEKPPRSKHPTRIVPWLRFRHSGTRKLPPDGKVRGTVFFSDVIFSTMPWPLLLSKLWPGRLISARNSPQSRTFSCHQSWGHRPRWSGKTFHGHKSLFIPRPCHRVESWWRIQ